MHDVSIGVEKGKSILVSGQNLKDLENLLEAVKDTDINVYTHNGLIVAHAYPKFAKYKNLKGHFQMSMDSVQYDFTTFKGPVLVIRNFQYLLDKLYRGRLFTTNLIAGKGMTRIEKTILNLLWMRQKTLKGLIVITALHRSKSVTTKSLLCRRWTKLLKNQKQRHKTPYCSGAFEPCCHAFSVL